MPVRTSAQPAAAPGLARARTRIVAVTLAGLAALVVLGAVSLALGSGDLPVSQLWAGLIRNDGISRASIIVWDMRMPRTALAIVVGAALAVAGVLMQALTRNPLAEPGLLGVNAGAAFVVVLAIAVFGPSTTGNNLWFAFGGSAAAAAFVYVVSIRRTHRSDHARLVLAGAALTASLAACTGAITMYRTDAFSSFRFWVIGTVTERTGVLGPVLPFIVAGLILALLCGPSLNAMALGDEQATALGARLSLVRVAAFAAITVLCGAATAAAGPIGFVGLAVPHLLRLMVGVDNRVLLPLSMLVGPVLVLASDIIGRVAASSGEFEVGIVTAFVGAPVLLVLLRRGR